MDEQLPRVFVCRSDLLASHCQGERLDEFARRARITSKTLRKALAGEGVAFSTVAKLARCLRLEPSQLLQGEPQSAASSRRVHFRLDLNVEGVVESRHMIAAIIPRLITYLSAHGVTAAVSHSQFSVRDKADLRRILGRLRVDRPSPEPAIHVYVAVRPSMWSAFKDAIRLHLLDLRAFAKYGEIIDLFDERSIEERLCHSASAPEPALSCSRFALELISGEYVEVVYQHSLRAAKTDESSQSIAHTLSPSDRTSEHIEPEANSQVCIPRCSQSDAEATGMAYCEIPLAPGDLEALLPIFYFCELGWRDMKV